MTPAEMREQIEGANYDYEMALDAVDAWEEEHERAEMFMATALEWQTRAAALEAGLREALDLPIMTAPEAHARVHRLRALLAAATSADEPETVITSDAAYDMATGPARPPTEALRKIMRGAPADAAGCSCGHGSEAHEIERSCLVCQSVCETRQAELRGQTVEWWIARNAFWQQAVAPLVHNPLDGPQACGEILRQRAAELAGLRACFETCAPRCKECWWHSKVPLRKNPFATKSVGEHSLHPEDLYCDRHAPADATDLPWASVARGEK